MVVVVVVVVVFCYFGGLGLMEDVVCSRINEIDNGLGVREKGREREREGFEGGGWERDLQRESVKVYLRVGGY